MDTEGEEVATGHWGGGLCSKTEWYNIYVADWSRSMDTWGWSLCKQNYLLIGLRRDGMGNALYNLAYGICAKLAEDGTYFGTQTVNSGNCYHENWWKRFDFKGGKFCRRGFFVSGLFRSHCNSLYCIEMAKCCQIKRSLWNVCRWKQISKGGWGGTPEWPDTAPKKASSYTTSEILETQSAMVTPGHFIAGFYRDEEHTLDGLTHFRE